MRVKLKIAYDGAPFDGWQRQSGGNAVQNHVEQALSEVCKMPVKIAGAGRTDAGVHALGQCAHADVPKLEMGSREWCLALNGKLPAAIRVMSAVRCADNFHSRYDATGKHYRYALRNAMILPPWEAGRVWLFPYDLDYGLMGDTAASLVGRHDFRRFSAIRRKEDEFSERTLTRCSLSRRGRMITFDIEGEGFLYKMIRIIVGMLVRVGSDRMSREEFLDYLYNPTAGRRSPYCAPAAGLTLVKVRYDRTDRESSHQSRPL